MAFANSSSVITMSLPSRSEHAPAGMRCSSRRHCPNLLSKCTTYLDSWTAQFSRTFCHAPNNLMKRKVACTRSLANAPMSLASVYMVEFLHPIAFLLRRTTIARCRVAG